MLLRLFVAFSCTFLVVFVVGAVVYLAPAPIRALAAGALVWALAAMLVVWLSSRRR